MLYQKIGLRLLPSIPLAGEIKIKDHAATKTVKLLKDNPLWKQAYFHVFDLVGLEYLTKKFSERYKFIKQIVRIACNKIPNCPLIAAEQVQLKSRREIISAWKAIIAKGGEGNCID